MNSKKKVKIKRLIRTPYLYFAFLCVCSFLLSCDDKLEIQQRYGFDLETMPIAKRIKVGESVEIRCQLVREGYYKKAKYYLRYFQPDGYGELSIDNGTIFTPNDLFPLERESFRLYYKSLSSDSHTIDVYIEDNMGQMVQKTFSFANED